MRSAGTPDGLRIGGLQPFSTVDWPGKLVAVLFLRGCPLACRYCHNPHLRDAKPQPDDVPWAEAYAFLERRRGLLDGVVISGGEPTIQAGLPAALAAIRDLGFATGLHTAGPAPDRLSRVLPLLDWVGIDLKASTDGYGAVAGVPAAGPRAVESVRRVVASGIDHEVRLTVHPALTTPADIAAVATLAADLGCQAFAVQAAGSRPGLDPSLPPPPADHSPTLPAALASRFARVFHRAA